jgi:hypothetical protein
MKETYLSSEELIGLLKNKKITMRDKMYLAAEATNRISLKYPFENPR